MALQKYQEAVQAGNVYIAEVKSVTVTVTTDTSPLPATTGRALLAIYNPPGSGKRLSVLRINVSHVSGTPGGPLYLNVTPPSTLITGVPTLPVNARDFTAGGGVGKVFAAFVPVNAVIATELRPLGGFAAVAIATASSPSHHSEDIDGMISVPPGGMLSIQSHAVGTSHVLSASIMYEEVSL
jgi:hypothetical protein